MAEQQQPASGTTVVINQTMNMSGGNSKWFDELAWSDTLLFIHRLFEDLENND